jgi:hypothetical protein
MIKLNSKRIFQKSYPPTRSLRARITRQFLPYLQVVSNSGLLGRHLLANLPFARDKSHRRITQSDMVWYSPVLRPAVIPLGAPLDEKEEEASCRLRWIVQNLQSEPSRDLFCRARARYSDSRLLRPAIGAETPPGTSRTSPGRKFIYGGTFPRAPRWLEHGMILLSKRHPDRNTRGRFHV